MKHSAAPDSFPLSCFTHTDTHVTVRTGCGQMNISMTTSEMRPVMHRWCARHTTQRAACAGVYKQYQGMAYGRWREGVRCVQRHVLAGPASAHTYTHTYTYYAHIHMDKYAYIFLYNFTGSYGLQTPQLHYRHSRTKTQLCTHTLCLCLSLSLCHSQTHTH